MRLAARVPGMWRFRGFEAADWWLLSRAAWVLPLRAVQLRMSGYGAATRPFAQSRSRRFMRARTATPLQLARRTAWIVELVSRYGVCRGKCLSRSLTLLDLLQQQGIDAELRIGVQKPTSSLEAHAWVECEGVALNDAPDVGTRFTAIPGVWPLP